MPSKKTSGHDSGRKRTGLPRSVDYTRSFVKDWERLAHSRRYDLNRLKQAMLMLIANDGPLGAEWLDHPLTGDWAGHRECHIGGDFLLAYRIEDQGKAVQQVVFVRAGSHADLFA